MKFCRVEHDDKTDLENFCQIFSFMLPSIYTCYGI
uniref:Uncharacterized protein n=1 Tax=Rhizophora mucronata TaxID=61149 RepID=A0A2P2R1A5_RHIMU